MSRAGQGRRTYSEGRVVSKHWEEQPSQPGSPLLAAQRNNATTNKSNPKKTVIIATQIRSGSNFAGSFISSLNNGWLTKEPVRSWNNDSYVIPKNKFNESIDFLQEVLKCKFRHLKYYLKRQQSQLIHAISEFCIPMEEESIEDNIENNISCNGGPFLEARCQTADVHVIKVVALRLRDLLLLLEKDNFNVQIVHLLRDPRGIMASIDKIKSKKPLHTPNFFCSNMRKDLQAAEQIATLYPKR